jgi:hypothetical protein
MGRARGAAVITAADHFDDVFGAKRGSGRVDVVYSPETASGRIALLRIAGIEPLVYAGGARLLIHHETEGDPKVVVASGGELWVHDDMTVYAYGDTEVVMRDQTTAFVYDNVEVSNTFGAGITIHGFGHSRLCVDSGVVAERARALQRSKPGWSHHSRSR